MRRPTQLELEIAAARLAAGYYDANDTDDDLADPYARAAIDYMLDCDRILDNGCELLVTDEGWLGDLVRLYLEITEEARA